MRKEAAPKEIEELSQESVSDEPVRTPYAEVLTKQARIDYEACADSLSLRDEIKLCRAMTLKALRAGKYEEARKWQQTLATNLRIEAKAKGPHAGRSDSINILLQAAHDSRIATSSISDDVNTRLLEDGELSAPNNPITPPVDDIS